MRSRSITEGDVASDAAAYTTGEQFLIDGGYTKF